MLKEKVAVLTSVDPYKTPCSSSSKPPLRDYILPPVNGLLPQRTRFVIHTLSRVDNEGYRPDIDNEQVPSYNGMQAYLHPPVERSKAYYQALNLQQNLSYMVSCPSCQKV